MPERSNHVSCRWLFPPVRYVTSPAVAAETAPPRTIGGHPVRQRQGLSYERGLLHIELLGHQHSCPHPQQPPASAQRSPEPVAVGQIHAAAVSGCQSCRGTPVQRAEVDPGDVRRARREEQEPATVGQKVRRAMGRLLRAERRRRYRRAPVAGTLISELIVVGANRMTPSAFHVAPWPEVTGATVCGAPPVRSSRFSAFPVKKAIERLSGDQKGWVAPSVPANDCAVVCASHRTHKRGAPSPAATNTICPAVGRQGKVQGLVRGGRDDLEARLSQCRWHRLA